MRPQLNRQPTHKGGFHARPLIQPQPPPPESPPPGPGRLIGGRKFARLLQLHHRIAAVDFALAAFGAKHAAAASGAGVSLAQLISHTENASPQTEMPEKTPETAAELRLFEFHRRAAAIHRAVAAFGDDELGLAGLADIALAHLISHRCTSAGIDTPPKTATPILPRIRPPCRPVSIPPFPPHNHHHSRPHHSSFPPPLFVIPAKAGIHTSALLIRPNRRGSGFRPAPE